MARYTKKETVEIVLTISKEEATLIKDFIQNDLTGDESNESRSLRTGLYKTLYQALDCGQHLTRSLRTDEDVIADMVIR